MSNFLNEKDLNDEKIKNAITSLQELEHVETLVRVYATVMKSKLISLFSKKKKLSNASTDILKLIHQKANEACPPNLQPPATEHPSLWKEDEKFVSFISQPYELNHNSIKAIIEFCEKEGFEVNINVKNSWHFPGRTLFVEFTTQKSK